MPSDELENAIIMNAKKDAIIYHAIELQSRPNRASVRLSPRVMRLTDESTRLNHTSRFPYALNVINIIKDVENPADANLKKY